MRKLLSSVAALLVSCGPPGTVAPSAARVEDLIGWWKTSIEGGEQVFGFVAPPDGLWNVPVDSSNANLPLSTIYVAKTPVIRSSFEVKDGTIVETVIDSVDLDPGTQLKTRIFALAPRRELTIESSAAGGRRTYAWQERCAFINQAGWSQVSTLSDVDFFATAATMAFDSRGRLHSFTGLSGQPGRFARPTYSVLDRGCEAVQFTVSNARSASLVIDASDGVHLFTTESALFSNDPDLTLTHRFRSAESTTWTTEQLSPTRVARSLRALSRAGRLVLLAGSELYEQRDGQWQVAPLPVTSAQGDLDSTGKLWLLSGTSLVRETSPGTFETATPLPMGTRAASDFYVDGADRPHVLIINPTRGHAIFENGSWRVLPTSRVDGFVRAMEPPWKFYAASSHAFPHLAFGTQRDDGVETWEFSSPRFFNPNTGTRQAAAIASDGTLAITETGELTTLKRPNAPWGVTADVEVSLSLGGTGTGRVWSDDGRVDCSSSCTVRLPAFSRIRLHTDPGPNSALSKTSGQPDDDFPARFAWLNVSPNAADFPDATNNALTFEFSRSVVRSVISLSPESGTSPSSVTQVAARGDTIALAANTTAGAVFFRDATYSADAGSAPGQALLFAPVGSTPLARRLPAAPQTLGVLDSGGVHAVFFADRALSFEATTLGSSAAPAIVHARWSAALDAQPAQAIFTSTSGMQLVASALDPAGHLAAVVQNPNGLGLGSNVLTALVWKKEGAAAQVTGLPMAVQLTTAQLAVRGQRVVIGGPSDVWIFDDGVQVGQRRLIGAEVQRVALSTLGVSVIVSATSGGVDLGGGSLNSQSGTQYLCHYGNDGAYGSCTSLGLVTRYTRMLAFESTTRGALVLNSPNTVGPELSYADTGDARFLLPTPAAIRVSAAWPDGTAMWALAQQQQASVDYEVITLTGAGRQVLVRAELP